MKARFAKIADAPIIYTLINNYAEQDKMLFRSMADIYENIRSFVLVEQNGSEAKALGIKKVFALTLEPGFFKKFGFKTIERKKLPMKVWMDCARCSKQENCDEIALIKHL